MDQTALVIGSGGREHALAWKLSQSAHISHVYVVPGNAGTHNGYKTSNIALNVKDHSCVVNWCKSHNIGLVVIGPEDPLANGLADDLQKANIQCFGPSQKAAQIEASKEFAKAFMDRHNIPTARWKSFTKADDAKQHIMSAQYEAMVIKASGLAAGKGVVVCNSREAAVNAVDAMKQKNSLGATAETIIIEELLRGEEISFLCFADGENISVMPTAQDHKRLLDGDQGPNTGGMGAYCHCPQISETLVQEIKQDILKKTIDGMKSEGFPYIGVLYAGLMLTESGPKVLEFNCRFGDPETQVLLPLMRSDLYEIMKACVDGRLSGLTLEWVSDKYAVGVVLVSEGYPGSYPKGKVISGIDQLNETGILVFHAGTMYDNGAVVTSGGRVLAVVAVDSDLFAASQNAQKAANAVCFEGAFYRKDIAHKAIQRAKRDGMTYKACGVDIIKADDLVHNIKAFANNTLRSGVVGNIGGFGGVFDLKAAGYIDPYLVSGTDGVGTKLKIAHACRKHDTIGIDLVAMCVNDILTQGAEPLFFLDYFACGKLDTSIANKVIEGVSEGCRQAGCALVGGETAEMPGMYSVDEYDLAGFSVGAVEKDRLLPLLDEIVPGDMVIGIQSSGIHSNGYSLVRKLVEVKGLCYENAAPFDNKKSLGEALLEPTKVYIKALLPLMKAHFVKAAAHITGGGLMENIPRVLPPTCGVILNASQWVIQPVFKWIAAEGRLSEDEMLCTFNCGLGMVVIVASNHKDAVLESIRKSGETCSIIGKVHLINEGDKRVVVDNFGMPVLNAVRRKRKVGVLISGSGTNLQSLIEHVQNESNQSSAELAIVISNVQNVEGLKRAERANIPTRVLSHKKYKSRVEFDMAVNKILREFGVHIVCLAGFMRILSAEFVNLWQGRLLNIHPALLPAFKGMNAHKQVLEMGARVTGCTVHFVEPAVDAGAIIEQAAVRVEVEDTETTLQEKVKVLEHKIYPQALELLASGKISRGKDGKVIWRCETGGALVQNYSTDS